MFFFVVVVFFFSTDYKSVNKGYCAQPNLSPAASRRKDTIESMVYDLHLQFGQRRPACYEELAGGFEPIRNGEIF